MEPESHPGQLAEDAAGPPSPRPYGPTPAADVGLLMSALRPGAGPGAGGYRVFGWAEAGYTGASTGSGLLSVQPLLNRYGNEFLLNELALVIQKPLLQDRFDWGVFARYYAGANAAAGQPAGGLDDPPGNPRFSQDFLDLYAEAHLPVLTDGGVNVKLGRMSTIIGYVGNLAPYRPFYSTDYQFAFSQVPGFTGALAEWVVSDRLDIWSGVTFGGNTFFTQRAGGSMNYIGQVNYWLQEEKRTRLTGSVNIGPAAVPAAPGLAGDFVTVVEARVQQNWGERFTQVVQSNVGWETDTPVGTGSWYGVYTLGIVHLNRDWDLLGRADWFDDAGGTRTGVDTAYAAVTLALNWHPVPCLEVRPEVRGDFAGRPAFGTNGAATDRGQLTGAVSALVKF